MLLRLARSRLAGGVVGWVCAHMSWALPVRRLHETPTLIAFHHPRPAYPFHVLIVPKAARRSLTDLSAADSDFLVDLMVTVNRLVADHDLAASGYRLIANGGAFQDVPQLHFHLVAGRAAGRTATRAADREDLPQNPS